MEVWQIGNSCATKGQIDLAALLLLLVWVPWRELNCNVGALEGPQSLLWQESGSEYARSNTCLCLLKKPTKCCFLRP